MSFILKTSGGDMHSHDRTMIANLGFGDKDRANSDHELACQYLVRSETASRLTALAPECNATLTVHQTAMFDHACPPSQYEIDCYQREMEAFHLIRKSGDINALEVRKYPVLPKPRTRQIDVARDVTYSFKESRFVKGLVEVPVHKGEGQYQTTVGFLDICLQFKCIYEIGSVGPTEGECRCCGLVATGWPHGAPPAEKAGREWLAIIEVKIAKCAVSEVIRQLLLYRSYVYADAWIIATPWMVDVHERDALKSHGISHIFLGEDFGRFQAAAAFRLPADSDFTF